MYQMHQTCYMFQQFGNEILSEKYWKDQQICYENSGSEFLRTTLKYNQEQTPWRIMTSYDLLNHFVKLQDIMQSQISSRKNGGREIPEVSGVEIIKQLCLIRFNREPLVIFCLQHKQLKSMEINDAWSDTFSCGYVHQF